MKRWMRGSLLTGLMMGFLAMSAESAEVGQPAPDFALTDTNGQSHSLSGYKGKFVVLEWLNYDCPFIKKHYGSGNMQNLQKANTAKGVVWLSINSSAPGKQGHFSDEEANKLMQEKGAAPSAYLQDPDGVVGKLYGARTTPHMFIVDPSGALIYQGALDSIPSTDPKDIPNAVNYVTSALEEAMNGKPVSESQTQSYGCSVKYAN